MQQKQIMLKIQICSCQCINCQNTVYGSLWFHSKDKATNFIADIGDNVKFMSFMDTIKLVGETEAQPTLNNNSVILTNGTSCCAIKVPK